MRRAGRLTAFVVLGGAISPDVSGAREAVALNEAAERMTAAVELARRYPGARIVFSGGIGELIYAGATEAEVALRLLREVLGIAPRGSRSRTSRATPSRMRCSQRTW